MSRYYHLSVVLLSLAFLLPGCGERIDPEEEVTVMVTSVELDKTRMDMTPGESQPLKAHVLPYHATHKEVLWSSSAPEIASVDAEGLVTALKTGLATITAKAGSKKAECIVRVLPKDDGDDSAFRSNVVEALQLRSSLVKSLQDSISYRPHGNVKVTEFTYIDHAGSRQAAFVMQVDLSDPTVSITNTTPGDAKFDAGVVQREKLSVQLGRIDRQGNRVVGGINTDFFTTTGTYAGRPSGAFWHGGVCYRSTFASEANRPRSFVWWGADEHVALAPSARYASVTTSKKVLELFSGGQILIEEGKLTTITEDSVSGVHPRTMFGTTRDDRKIILVVIDGRQNNWSVGVDYEDMQAFMKAVGCYNALNIDGGGSSTFIVRKEGSSFTDEGRFQVRNKPSDGSERAIGPGLAVVVTD